MYKTLKDSKGNELLRYRLSKDGNEIIEVMDITAPADFKTVQEWLKYNRSIDLAFRKVLGLGNRSISIPITESDARDFMAEDTQYDWSFPIGDDEEEWIDVDIHSEDYYGEE